MRQSAVILAIFLSAAPALAQEGIRLLPPEKPHEPVLTRPPEVTRFVPAAYPEEARAAGLEAEVGLQVDLDATGTVTAVEVLRPAHVGDQPVAQPAGAAFDAAAVEAVKAFGFRPAEVDNVPAPVRIEYDYHFTLQQVVAEPAPGEAAPPPEPAIRGTVRERGTHLPIVGAAVSIEGRDGEISADQGGAYAVPDLPPGTYHVLVNAPGFNPGASDVEVKAGMVAELTFYLKPQEEDTGYVTIVRGKREQDVVARYTISQRALTTVPGTFGDPVRVVQNLPGVARSPYVLGLLLVRGSSPSDSAIFVDGVPVPLIYHFLGGPSIIAPDFLSRIDFYPGNFGARFGQATAGIIDIGTASDTPEDWHGTADVNLFFAGAFVEIPVAPKASLKLALRRSYYDLVLPIVFKAMGRNTSTIVPVYYDYQARFDMGFSDDDHMHLFAFGSDDALRLATGDGSGGSNSGVDLTAHTSFHRLTGEHLWHITPDVTSRMSPWVGIDVSTFDMGNGNIDITTWSGGLREEVSWRAHETLELRPGIDLTMERYSFTGQVPPTKNYIVPGQSLTGGAGGAFASDSSGTLQSVSRTLSDVGLAAYLEAIWSPVERLKIIPGIRAQSYFYNSRARFRADPRMVVRVDVGADTILKAGAGLYSKLPPEYLLDPVYGNPDLTLEWSDQYSVGVEHDFTKDIHLDVQGFFIRRHDRAVQSSALTYSDGSIQRVNAANDGTGRAYGLEVLLKHDVTKWFYGWVSYTLSRSEESNKAGDPLSPSRFDQTHILTVVASVRPGMGWEIGARFRLVSGNPTTPRLDGTFVADRSGYTPFLGARDSDRESLFHQLDLRVEKTWEFEQWMLSFYVDVQNVYYAKNTEAIVWDYRSRQSWQVPGIPILPSFGFKGRF